MVFPTFSGMAADPLHVPLGLYEIIFFMAKRCLFCKMFCKQHVFLPHHPFCIGVSADKGRHAEVFKKAKVDPMAKPPQKPEQPKAADSSSKKKREWTDESQL